ncbi:MAG: hypothetical protein HPY71_08450 [Firmicutes bacterium]|nr:hypothetical protein [Bacillota bacterium]
MSELKVEAIRQYLSAGEVEHLLVVLAGLDQANLASILQGLDISELHKLIQLLQTRRAAGFFEQPSDTLKGVFDEAVCEIYAQKVTKQMFAEDLTD